MNTKKADSGETFRENEFEMNTNWMRTFKSELRWALRVSPKKESSRRKSFFLRRGGDIRIFRAKNEARYASWCGENWIEDQGLNVIPVKVRVTVEEI